jgi:hypothetical protein
MNSDIDRQKLLIEMVMRQTQYTYEEAAEQLEKFNNDYIKVIRESMGINKVEDKTVKSINQHVYKEIRGLMDDAASSYRRKKEMEEKKAELIEKLKEEYERRKSVAKEELPSIRENEDEEEKKEEEAEEEEGEKQV